MFKTNKIDVISFLMYRVGKELFATRAKHILSILDAKQVFNNNEHSNVITLYGQLIPIYHASEEIGLPKPRLNEKTCLVIVNLTSENRNIGFIVSEVLSLTDIGLSNIKNLPELGKRYKSKGIQKYFIHSGQITRIINFNQLMDDKTEILSSSYFENEKTHLIS